MAHLFISHSTRDGAAQALALARALEALGHRCWIAPRDVKPAVPYPGQIVAAIEEGVGLVLLVTPGANESPDVLQEVQLASSARKPIAPVIVASAAPSPDLRYYVGVRHQIAWAEAAATAQALMATFVLSPSPSLGEGVGGGVKHDGAKQSSDPRLIPGAVWRDTIPGLPADACPEMVTIPPGRFLMGAPKSEVGSSDNERPQHDVRIDYTFAMGRYPATVSMCDPKFGGRDRRPMFNVSWEDAKRYIDWLNCECGLTDITTSYRLPSEAEWEYACRAGTKTPFSFGATITAAQANYNGKFTYGEGEIGENRGEVTVVGEFPANAFGLYDMHGNVWEWCEDAWNPSHKGAPIDGSARLTGRDWSKVLRGGCWNNDPNRLRSANRDYATSTSRDSSYGFRLARTLPLR